MNTQQRIDRIAEELRDIYQNTNEGKRLIAEMVEREFPDSMEFFGLQEEIASLERQLARAEERIEELRDED